MKEDNKNFNHVDAYKNNKGEKSLKNKLVDCTTSNQIEPVSSQKISKDKNQGLSDEQLGEVAGGMGFREWCAHVSRGY